MNSKIVILFAFFAILFGCVLCNVEEVEASSSIKLQVFGGSNEWWIAVDPRDDADGTDKVELREASSSNWVTMQPNPSWGYFQASSTSGRGFALPLSFRLTSSSGSQVTIASVLSTISAGALVDTRTSYSAPSNPTDRPTQRPTQRPSQAPTERPTQAPTERPTQAPTQKPTQRPTQAPTDRPTQRPTQAPTDRPTQAPTQRPTQAPTDRPTQAPTQRPSQAPTQRPTNPPTTRPTAAPSTDLCSIVPTSTEPIKYLVPLYVYPGAAWDQVVTAAKAGAPTIAIINPNSGPASSPDSSYVSYMKKLNDAGVEMVGYVHTSYGARPLSEVQSEIDTYASKYTGLKGIFLDEGSASASDLPYYQSIYNYIRAKSGFVHVIVNPGVQPDQGYMAVSTNIVIYEDSAANYNSGRFASWIKCAPNQAAKAGYQYKFSGIIHTASLSSMPNLISQMHNAGMGLVYVTDGAGGCCTYNSLASYFTQEGTTIASLN